jgi:hypothetical protein
VLFLRQHFGLERLQARGQRCTPFPNLPGADQPEGRILREARGVVDILIPSQPAVDRLPQQVRQRQLDILAPPRIAQVMVHEFAQAETLVHSRTRTNPPSEVTREPWKSTFSELMNES